MEPRVEFIKTHVDAQLPKKASAGAAGFDLACVERFNLVPGQRALVSTGLKIAVPHGYEAQVRPRSGLAYKLGITVLNTPGTIDEDYRGDLQVLLVHQGTEVVGFAPGDRIAQLVVSKVDPVVVQEVSTFSDTTERGEGGFGSTGTS